MKTVIYDLKRNGKIIGAFCIFSDCPVLAEGFKHLFNLHAELLLLLGLLCGVGNHNNKSAHRRLSIWYHKGALCAHRGCLEDSPATATQCALCGRNILRARNH